jgi:hypothetical protein
MQKKWLFMVLVLALAISASGCGEKDGTTVVYEDDGVIFETNIPEGSEGQWCPIGSSWVVDDPNSGEVYYMEIVGTKVIDGVNMCHAVYEAADSQDDISKVEYFWSEDEDNFIMTLYDSRNDVVSEVKILDGTTTMTSEDGSVTVITEDGTITSTAADGTVTSFGSGEQFQ